MSKFNYYYIHNSVIDRYTVCRYAGIKDERYINHEYYKDGVWICIDEVVDTCDVHVSEKVAHNMIKGAM